MKCPKCKQNDDGVINSQHSPDKFSIWRERQCKNCGNRWYTQEIEDEPPVSIYEIAKENRK